MRSSPKPPERQIGGRTAIGTARVRRYMKPYVYEQDDQAYLLRAKDRFWSKVEKSTPYKCWEWKAAKHKSGYGAFSYRGGPIEAHRIAVLLDGRSIPDGMWIDHICRNHACVNPAHLRVVEPRINCIENSISVTAINAAKTHCHRGHPFDDENTSVRNGTRECRACRRETANRRYHETKVKRPPRPRPVKTHCPKGHAYKIYDDGRKRCPTCMYAYDQTRPPRPLRIRKKKPKKAPPWASA